jgi:hypothetical protein
MAWPDQPAPLTLGDTRAQLVYTPVTPCRIIDTRRAGGSLAPGVIRNFKVTGGGHEEQGGSSQGCGIPVGRATAALINFVAVNPVGAGDIRAWAYSDPPAPPPSTSIVNYAFIPDSGFNVANGIVVPICDPAHTSCPGFDLKVQADRSATHLVADVLGFFERFPTEEVPGLAVPVGAIVIWDQSTNCPTGYTRVTAFDGRFLRGASSAGGSGGADSHTHDIAHTHGMGGHTHGGTTADGGVDHTHSGETSGIHRGLDFVLKSDGGHVSNHTHVFTTGGASAYVHSHGFTTGGPSTSSTEGSSTTTRGSASSLPPYFDVLFCRKN